MGVDTKRIADEGLYTIECALLDANKTVERAAGLVELVAPPSYGPPGRESRP